MTVQVKRVYEKPSAEDGYRILVDRLWPRGLRKKEAEVDLWLKDIAPTNELRKWFHHEAGKWDDFRARYVRELAERGDLLDRIRELEREHGTVTLLFGAKDTERNQAVVIAEALR